MTMNTTRFDRQEQYDKIASGLLPGETIIAVYDAIGGGTGFIGVTDLRVILQDNSFVGKKVALTPDPAPVETTVEAVAEAEAVPEIIIEAPKQKRGPGRPKKSEAPVKVEDDDGE